MIHTQCEDGMFVRTVENADSKGAIFYIHGLGESGLGFEKLMTEPKLARWSHIALDIPGYGKSPWPDEPPGFDEIVYVLAEWINKNKIAPVVILGHSMGGVLGTLLCEKHASSVKAFINVEGNISFSDCTFSGKVAAYDLDKFLISGFEEICGFIYEGGIKDKSLRGYYASLRMCNPRAYHGNSIELVEISKTETLAKRLSALAVPVQYIIGSPRGIGEYSRKLLKEAGIDYKAVENAGHWPYADRPDEFLDAICGFLGKFG